MSVETRPSRRVPHAARPAVLPENVPMERPDRIPSPIEPVPERIPDPIDVPAPAFPITPAPTPLEPVPVRK